MNLHQTRGDISSRNEVVDIVGTIEIVTEIPARVA